MMLGVLQPVHGVRKVAPKEIGHKVFVVGTGPVVLGRAHFLRCKITNKKLKRKTFRGVFRGFEAKNKTLP